MKRTRKVAMITGASHGIGRELAFIFARNGYVVLIHGRNRRRLEHVRNEIIKRGGVCVTVLGDITHSETIQKLYTAARKRGISVFVNNAGVTGEGQIADVSIKQIDRVLCTNLVAPIKLIKKIHALFLKKGGGSVITINSISGLETQTARPIYSASKWGLRGFTESLKEEALRHNIRVIDVYPSRVKTRPEFTYGMEPQELAEKVYCFFAKTNGTKLIVDNRPKRYKRYA